MDVFLRCSHITWNLPVRSAQWKPYPKERSLLSGSTGPWDGCLLQDVSTYLLYVLNRFDYSVSSEMVVHTLRQSSHSIEALNTSARDLLLILRICLCAYPDEHPKMFKLLRIGRPGKHPKTRHVPKHQASIQKPAMQPETGQVPEGQAIIRRPGKFQQIKLIYSGSNPRLTDRPTTVS